MKILEHLHQLVGWVEAVDHERYFRFETFEKSSYARAQRLHTVRDSPRLGNDRFSRTCKFRLSCRPAIEKRNAELRFERINRVADGRVGPPQAFGSPREASLLNHGQQDQELVHGWCPWRLHVEIPEKNFQFYTGFLRSKKP